LVHETQAVIEVFQTAAAVQELCLQARWKFCIIGGVALQRWGEPRFTRDVDLTLYTGFGKEEAFIKFLLQHFQPRVEKAAEFALANRVLLLQSKTGVGIDVALGGLPFEEHLVARASYFQYPPNLRLLTASAEDLIVMKAFADRGQDWVDVERILVRQGGKLDWDYVLAQLRDLAALKESPEIVDRLKKLRADCEN
jgi:hypothetical protein